LVFLSLGYELRRSFERNEREESELLSVLGMIGYEDVDRISIEIYREFFDSREDEVIFEEEILSDNEISLVVSKLVNYTKRSPNHPSYSGIEANVLIHLKNSSPSLEIRCNWMERDATSQPSHYFHFSLVGSKVGFSCVNEALFQYLNDRLSRAKLEKSNTSGEPGGL